MYISNSCTYGFRGIQFVISIISRMFIIGKAAKGNSRKGKAKPEAPIETDQKQESVKRRLPAEIEMLQKCSLLQRDTL